MTLPASKVKRAIYGALFISVLFSAIYVYGTWLASSAHGTNAFSEIAVMAIGGLGITILLVFLTMIYETFRLLFRVKGAEASQVGALAAFCGICTFVMFIAILIAGNYRSQALRTIRARAFPLIVAIEHFQVKNHTLPDKLEDLVPDYLPVIPDTGVGAYPKYQYLKKPDLATYDGNPWVLFVDVSDNELTRDLLIYYPDQNYPTNPIGRNVRKHADWAIIGTPRHDKDKN